MMKPNDDDFKRILDEIDEMLENNPEKRAQMEAAVQKIEDILGYPVDISVIMYDELLDYEEGLGNMEIELNDINDGITLGEFINYIKSERQEYKIVFDPLYLEKGLNTIENVLVTTIDDKVIIVPKRKENEE